MGFNSFIIMFSHLFLVFVTFHSYKKDYYYLKNVPKVVFFFCIVKLNNKYLNLEGCTHFKINVFNID